MDAIQEQPGVSGVKVTTRTRWVVSGREGRNSYEWSFDSKKEADSFVKNNTVYTARVKKAKWYIVRWTGPR